MKSEIFSFEEIKAARERIEEKRRLTKEKEERMGVMIGSFISSVGRGGG